MTGFAAERRTSPASLHGKRILIVEDEYLVADELVLELTEQGAVVVGPLPTLGRAMAALGADNAIDGAVLDVNLRGEMVFPLADVLRERGVPFVFATGYERWSIPTTYQGIAMCEKPVDLERLTRVLFG